MKYVKKTVRHYWKYSYEDATTPAFTSQAQAESGIDGYKMLTSSNKWGVTSTSTVTSSQGTVFTFDLGEDCLSVTRLDYVSTYSWNQWLWMTLSTLEGSVDGIDWTLIADKAGSGREGDYQNNIDITEGNSFRYIRFTCWTSSTGWAGGAKNLSFLYSRKIIIPATQDDYDFYTDDEVALLPSNIVRHYWKYINTPLQQPVLTSNGELGGSSFAVSASYAESGHPAYYLLDGNSSSYYSCWQNDGGNYYTFYNPKPFKIDTLTFVFKKRGSYSEFATTTIEGSNDNINWTSLEKSWNSNGTMTVNNNTYYKYYKIYQRYYWTAYSCAITATEQTIVAGTSSDYDYYTDDTVYYGINQ